MCIPKFSQIASETFFVNMGYTAATLKKEKNTLKKKICLIYLFKFIEFDIQCIDLN